MNKLKLFVSFAFGLIFIISFQAGLDVTSTDDFCQSCHVHPQADLSWKQGAHFDNASGTIAHCVDCHLPPEGMAYLTEKVKTGSRDLFSYWFKDESEFDWQQASSREAAMGHVYEASCLNCHQNLFSRGLSKKGQDAHLHYSRKKDELRCLNCHLEVGHFSPKKTELTINDRSKNTEIFQQATRVDSFVNYTEKIPATSVSFEMIAIPGGEFTIGSPENEAFRKENEGPQRQVKVDSFWMGQAEVTWDEYDAFYRATATAGRSEDQISDGMSGIDAISGPTPAYGDPSQGWGRGQRPAITMSFYAAEKYCEWLSQNTGKKYRLPTEAEWEFACRAGTAWPYFIPGQPADFNAQSWMNKIFGTDTTIYSYIFYAANSRMRSVASDNMKPNDFGLKNMLGNVKEFCSDWYAAETYATYPENSVISNPAGPATGTEHVVRGGSFKSGAGQVRAASRERTHYDQWMRTDPQLPKSLWWYSDNSEVGFRVVCEYYSSK
ncbi:MAG: hypothetical protein DWQ05_17340 [Calditrichaeota bacterium]|nr:MAG: hypothetical protein DWQ05_17340 [Calditrichota bacterium]